MTDDPQAPGDAQTIGGAQATDTPQEVGGGQATPAAAPISSPFVFTGRAGTYFRIWAISLCLSILTVGVYSAWGKVRKRRYLYAHTLLDGTGFDYRASPLAILRGRAAAVALFGGFALGGHFLPLLRLVLSLVLIVLLPWIIVASARFNARNSAWRNITFGFDGTIREASKVLFGFGTLAILTLGLGYPYYRMRRARFVIQHHRFGSTPFKTDLAAGGFIVTYLLAGIAGIAGVVLLGLGAGVTAAATKAFGLAASPFVIVAFMVLTYTLYIALFACIRASVGNLTFNAIIVGPLRGRSALRKRDMAWLYVSNVVVVLATLGLATPWVTVRMARYHAGRRRLVGESTPDSLTGAVGATAGATGSEVSDLFDIDVSL